MVVTLDGWVGGSQIWFFFFFSLKCAAGQCCNDNAFDKNQTSWMSLWGKDDGHKSLYDDFDLNNCCVIIMDSFYRAQIFFAKQKVQCAVTHHSCTHIYVDINIIYCLGNGLSRLVKSLSKEESMWCTTSCHIYGILSFVSLSVLSRKILRCIHVQNLEVKFLNK